MSEHTAHVGANEDASRILLAASDLDALFKDSLDIYYDTALCVEVCSEADLQSSRFPIRS